MKRLFILCLVAGLAASPVLADDAATPGTAGVSAPQGTGVVTIGAAVIPPLVIVTVVAVIGAGIAVAASQSGGGSTVSTPN
jgi:hypothetical protein